MSGVETQLEQSKKDNPACNKSCCLWFQVARYIYAYMYLHNRFFREIDTNSLLTLAVVKAVSGESGDVGLILEGC